LNKPFDKLRAGPSVELAVSVVEPLRAGPSAELAVSVVEPLRASRHNFINQRGEYAFI